MLLQPSGRKKNPTKVIPGGTLPGYVPFGTPAFDLNFWQNIYVGAASASEVLATDANGTRDVANAAGALTTFGAGVLARTDLGVRRATSIGGGNIYPYPSLNGAVSGSPGTMPDGFSPTMWSGAGYAGVDSNMDRTITNHADYVDIRFHGTAAANSMGTFTVGQIPMTDADSLTWKITTSMPDGNLNNVQFFFLRAGTKDSGGGNLTDNSVLTPSMTTTPTEVVRTAYNPSNAAIASTTPYFQIISTSGGAIDFTLRIQKNSFIVTVEGAAGTESLSAIGPLATALQATVGTVLVEIGSAINHAAVAGSPLSGRILSARHASTPLDLIRQHGPTRMMGKGMTTSNSAYAGAGGIRGVSRIALAWDNAASAGAGQIKVCYNGGTVVTIAGKINDGVVGNTVDTALLLEGMDAYVRRIITWTTSIADAELKTQTALTTFDHNVADAVNLFGRGAPTFDSDFDNPLSMVTRVNPSLVEYGDNKLPAYNNDGKFNPRQINGRNNALGFTNYDGDEYQFGLDPTHPDIGGPLAPLSPFSQADGIVTVTGRRVGAAGNPAGLNTLMQDTTKFPDLNTASGTYNPATDTQGRHPYSSGTLTTQGTFAQAFGYWEALAAADPYYPGRWSAFWTFGERTATLARNAAILSLIGENPAGAMTWPPEIDIMECQTAAAFANVHFGATGWGGSYRQIEWGHGKSINDYTGNDWTDYHSYAVDWKQNGDMHFYLDGRRFIVFTAPIAGVQKYPGGGNWTLLDEQLYNLRDYAGQPAIPQHIIMTHTIGSDQGSLDGTIGRKGADMGGGVIGTGQQVDGAPDEVRVRWRHAKVWSA
ncbi:MAG: family 16 glycosylhydrolase [Beijerinckiaceae bacterium]|nr:family 16 glycosylhydrolase [Beijerinckiaceae bacterium]